MKAIYTCPFGHECERIRDNQLERCALYTTIDGTNDKGEKTSESKCALAWQPILMLDLAGVSRGQRSVMESARNKFFELANGQNRIKDSSH